MYKVIILVIFSCCAAPALAQDIDVYFSPNGGCEQAVIEQIKKANQTIDIAMYYLSDPAIARALGHAQERGLAIRIVLDQGQEIESASKSSYLIKHGLVLRYHLGFGLMHNKFAVIDHQTLITGSFNWTTTAEERNEENLLIIRDPATIARFEERFAYLWNTSRPDSRNARGLDAVPAWFCTTFHIFCSN